MTALHDRPTSQADIVERRIIVRQQLAGARENKEIICATCAAAAMAWRFYRCRECGIFFCASCSLDHFGIKVTP